MAKAVAIFMGFFALIFTIHTSGNPLVPLLWAIVVGGGAYLITERLQNSAEAARLHRSAQEGYRRSIDAICDSSIDAFENIPKHLLSSEELLDVAENEFRESVFSPFWDSIERALHKLGAVNSNVGEITTNSARYRDLATKLDTKPPPFPVDPEAAKRLAIANGTARRLQKIVRTAQANFQFATIYEQRRTNAILVEGFTTLESAISGLGPRLDEGFARLASEAAASRDAAEEQAASIKGAVEAATAQAATLAKTASSSEAKRDQRAEVALGMLDNIQRRRTPPPLSKY